MRSTLFRLLLALALIALTTLAMRFGPDAVRVARLEFGGLEARISAARELGRSSSRWVTTWLLKALRHDQEDAVRHEAGLSLLERGHMPTPEDEAKILDSLASLAEGSNFL